MRENELLFGQHGEGGTEQRGIGTPMPPMVPMLRGPEGRTSRLPGHLTHSPKEGPELGAEFPSR
jgi:hypothetical protein